MLNSPLNIGKSFKPVLNIGKIYIFNTLKTTYKISLLKRREDNS